MFKEPSTATIDQRTQQFFKPKGRSPVGFHIELGRCQRKVDTFRNEAILASRLIQQKARAPIYVCLSGGASSLAVAESFRIAQVPFRAAIHRFKKDLNFHDICRAVIYCEANGVPYDFFEEDVEAFFKTKFPKFKRLTKSSITSSPSTSALIEKISHLGGYAVAGGGLPGLAKAGSKLWLQIHEDSFALERWARKKGVPCEPRFFSSNPHFYFSYLTDISALDFSVHSQDLSLAYRNQIFLENFNLPAGKSYSGYEKMTTAEKIKPRVVAKISLEKALEKMRLED